MRVFIDWRDLPPVPRLGAANSGSAARQCVVRSCSALSDVESSGSNLGKRLRPECSNVDMHDNDSEEDIFVSRKRARHSTRFPKSDADRGKFHKDQLPAVEKADGELQPYQSTKSKDISCSQTDRSKEQAGSPTSDVSTTTHVTDDESSDEEAVLRVIRRQRKHTRTSHSPGREARPVSKIRQLTRRDSTCSSDDPDRRRQALVASKKRRRSSSRAVDSKRERWTSKRRRASGETAFRHRDDSTEPHLEESSPVSECDRNREPSRKNTTSSCRRRRCARQSTGTVTVPWYLLDEERRPRRLRSKSRNCAARCVYWTRTEHRLFFIAKSPIHNRGLYAWEDIPAFVPVIEYAGEVITQVQSEIREWAYQTRHMDEVYMYQLRKETTNVIDGTLRGGPAKFVNHSCEPNVVAEEISAGGTNRVWFFSLRPIRKHEEILVDYCLSYEPGDVKRPCKCRARTCRKFLNYDGLTN